MDLSGSVWNYIKSMLFNMITNMRRKICFLNLIDTPGHVISPMEVSRSIAACEGALLIVDAARQFRRRPFPSFIWALENDLEIIPF